MRNHPENDGSFTPTTRTEFEIIERAELIARSAQITNRLLGIVCIAFAESAKCDLNYYAPPKLSETV